MNNINVVAIRMVKERAIRYESNAITCPEDVYKLLCKVFDADTLAEENVWAVLLDTKRHVISVQCVSRGTINASLVHPREVFKAAILANATSIIIAHNHPSGSLEAGIKDREVTRKIRQAGQILGIELDDHLVISSEGFTSVEA